MNKSIDFKDRAILLGWVAGLLLIISLLWSLSQPIVTHNLLRSVNNVFINRNDSRRVIANIPVKTGKINLFGYWYSMNNSEDVMFVFSVFQDGILVPLGAVISGAGTVREVIPLSAHAVQVFEGFPESVLRIYINRIETAVSAVLSEGSLR